MWDAGKYKLEGGGVDTIIRTWALEQHATKVAEDRQMDSSLLLGNGTSGSTTSGEVLD